MYVVICKEGEDKYGNESWAVGPFDSHDAADAWMVAEMMKEHQMDRGEMDAERKEEGDPPLTDEDWQEAVEQLYYDAAPWLITQYHVSKIKDPQVGAVSNAGGL